MIMLLMDVMLAIGLLLAVVITALLGPSLASVMLAIGLSGCPSSAACCEASSSRSESATTSRLFPGLLAISFTVLGFISWVTAYGEGLLIMTRRR